MTYRHTVDTNYFIIWREDLEWELQFKKEASITVTSPFFPGPPRYCYLHILIATNTNTWHSEPFLIYGSIYDWEHKKSDIEADKMVEYVYVIFDDAYHYLGGYEFAVENVLNTLDPIESLTAFFQMRENYLKLKALGLTDDEIGFVRDYLQRVIK